MKANELRIGNWIKYEDKLVQVVQVSSMMILCQRDENQFLVNCLPEDYEPIELTEEVLEKIGFAGRKYIDTPYTSFVWENKTIEYQSGDCEYDVIICVCKYLHELQNAYFLLTGQELNIEL